jgi:four helix bundle protein
MKNNLMDRTGKFSISVLDMVRQLPNSIACRAIADQLVRSSSAVDANYRAVCNAGSEKEYSLIMNIVLEEADQICFWIKFIQEKKWLNNDMITNCLNEAYELTAILTGTLKPTDEKTKLN